MDVVQLINRLKEGDLTCKKTVNGVLCKSPTDGDSGNDSFDWFIWVAVAVLVLVTFFIWKDYRLKRMENNNAGY